MQSSAEIVHGHVESIAPASGQEFALLPPDNATGNFTKVVQRIPVRIALDSNPNSRIELRPGLSVIPTIATRSPDASHTAAVPASIHKTNSGASCHVKSEPVNFRAADLARNI
jgi:membrane fusion protein (multidrug efflux system)